MKEEEPKPPTPHNKQEKPLDGIPEPITGIAEFGESNMEGVDKVLSKPKFGSTKDIYKFKKGKR